jgi:hypothetical protein
MGLIFILTLLLLAAIAFKTAAFVITCLIIAFKICLIAGVGYLTWKVLRKLLSPES